MVPSNALCLLLFVIAVSESTPQNATQSRIVGGSNAAVGAFPYQVSLRNPVLNLHFCGGSIISPNWILTAAGCVPSIEPNEIRAVVGTNYLRSGGTAYGISQITMHQSYNPQNAKNDIAVLRINGAISYGPNVQSIGLSSSTIPAGTQLTLSGWGLTMYPGQMLPNSLQHIMLTSISIPQCQAALPRYPVFDTHVCTNGSVGKGACFGDQGGPLVSNVQVGIVSWGVPCARGSPDVFTSVASYRSWIRQVTGV